MRRLTTLLVTLGLLALAVPLATVQASRMPALAVHIEAETTLIPGDGSYGPFTATGPAVDAGLICPSGQTTDVGALAGGLPSHFGYLTLVILKQFVCDDGSGDFVVQLEVRLDGRGDHFAWSVGEGTGSYTFLHGGGRGYGAEAQGDYDILDVYHGMVTNPG